MVIGTSANVLTTDDNLTGRRINFSPSHIAREYYLYLMSAGSYTADTEITIKGVCSGHVMIYTISGAGKLNLGSTGCIIGPREGAVIHSSNPISICADLRTGVPWEFLVFHIDGRSMPIYYSQLTSERSGSSAEEAGWKNGFARFRTEEGSIVDSSIRRLSDIALLPGTAQSELLASTFITNILTELIVNHNPAEGGLKPMPRYIEGIMKYINNYYRQQITLDELAAEFNVSKFHLSREFKKYTGYSPNEYVITVRISHAKELLRNTAHTITEIAQITGCGDVNHFIQLFKNREKVTPAVFRRRWSPEKKA